MTRANNETYLPDLENPELRELVGLVLAVERRAEYAFEEAREASAIGDRIGETAARTRLNAMEGSSNALAQEIRAIDPNFPFLKIERWFAERQSRAA
jgi:hypothetical protein